MKRRSFLKSSLLAAGIGSMGTIMNATGAEAAATTAQEFYELRVYQLRRGKQSKRFQDFFANAAVPALRRAGTGPVGVFTTSVGVGSPSACVLIPYASAEALVAVNDALEHDEEYQKAGADFLNTSSEEPFFERVESSFLRAFKAMPKLAVPAKLASGKPRLYELRTYESHSRKANLAKIGMFNDHELPIFKRAGLEPVFFGEALIGSRLPSLTYMLSFEDSQAHDTQWHNFSVDPDWKKLSSTPGFTDGEIVSSITNSFLRPAACSQI